MTDSVYADDLELIVITPAQAEPLLSSLEQGAGGIVFYVCVNKMDFICCN